MVERVWVSVGRGFLDSADLKHDETFDDLTPHQQGKLFAEKVGRSNLARYIHQARLGKLTLDGLRRGLRDPQWAREIAEDLDELVG